MKFYEKSQDYMKKILRIIEQSAQNEEFKNIIKEVYSCLGRLETLIAIEDDQ